MTNKKQLQKEIKDEGYISDNSSRNNRNNKDQSEQQKNNLSLKRDKQIKQLEQQKNFEAQKAQNYLTQITKLTAELDGANLEIKELKKIKPTKTQQELEKALIEANQKIREQEKEITNLNHNITWANGEIKEYKEKIKDLQTKNNSLIETITNLKNQGKIKEKNKEPNKLFTCFTCQKTFSCKLIRLIDKNNKKVCRDCLLKMLNRANQETGEEIVLRKKKKEEINEISQPPTFICQTCQQNYQGQPHQVHISNYQEQGIIPQQLTSICSYCLQDKVVIADLYCPRTSEGRDT